MVLGRRSTYYYGLLAAILMFGAMVLLVNPAWAQATINKTDEPDPVEVGEFLLYTLTVTNTTGAPLVVVVEDDLPDSVDFEAISVNGGTADECEVNTNDPEVVCVIALAAENDPNDEDIATIQILVDPDQVEKITNEAVVSEVTAPAACAAAGYNPDDPDCSPGNFLDDVDEETTVVNNDNNNNNNGNNNSPNDDFFSPNDDFFSPNDDFFNDLEEDLEEAEEDLNDLEGEVTTSEDDFTTGEGTTGTDGGAFADSGDPDDQPPVSGPRGEVVDEVPTQGPLPNTPGISLIGMALWGAIWTLGGAVVIYRLTRGRR